MRIKVNPYVVIIIAVLFAILSGIAGYLKIIPDTLVQQIIGDVVTFLLGTGLMLVSRKEIQSKISHSNDVLRDHIRGHL